ncbi:MAG: ATP-dependent endonuclease [Phycisphaerales bacterium JB054]
MQLLSATLSGLFGFRDEATLTPAPVATAIIGRNNTGKSSILQAIHHALVRNWGQPEEAWPKLWRYEGTESSASAQVHLRIAVPTSIYPLQSEHQEIISTTSDSLELLVSLSPHHKQPDAYLAKIEPNLGPWPEEAKQIWQGMGGLASTTAKHMKNSCCLLSSWRSENSRVTGGKSLHEALLKISNPGIDNRHLLSLFHRIENLFRELSGMPGAQLRPSGSDASIMVIGPNNLVLPLARMGDGLLHLLHIAYELGVQDNRVLLIEEPELGVHPALQRVFARHIAEQLPTESCSNQVLFATHSSIFLNDGVVDRVFRVQREADVSTVSECAGYTELRSILDDLDVRASDLLQANVCIWVEGPSDRILLKRWLELVEGGSRFIEGIHYQIVFYGGRLAAHLSAEHVHDHRHVRMLALSRHLVFMVDSDRPDETVALNTTKTRIQDEVERADGVFWVTAGREIENYFSPALVERTVESLTGVPQRGTFSCDQYGKFNSALASLDANGTTSSAVLREYSRFKVDFAREAAACMSTDDLDVLDLRDRLTELVTHLERCNPKV